MAKRHTTRYMSDEHEKFVEDLYSFDGAKRSRSSGASWHAPVDVVTDSLVIECECTDSKSYTLKLDFWKEAQEKIFGGREAALAIRFRDPHNKDKTVDLLIINIHDDAERRNKN